jgi:hypothetical protein
VGKWASTWRSDTLRVAGIPKSQFALDVLSAWRRSTPVEPWTNNPLGMPARGNGVTAAFSTPYGVFTSVNHFATTFNRFMATRQGTPIRHILTAGDSLTDAWREIHAIGWPAVKTETDYPVVLLDMVETRYRDKLVTRQSGGRKSSGTTHAAPEVHEAMKRQARALTDTANAFSDGRTAIGHIIRRLG